MAIPPPTPDKYLHNIVWLENKDFLIEFFKVKILSYFLTAGLTILIFHFFHSWMQDILIVAGSSHILPWGVFASSHVGLAVLSSVKSSLDTRDTVVWSFWIFPERPVPPCLLCHYHIGLITVYHKRLPNPQPRIHWAFLSVTVLGASHKVYSLLACSFLPKGEWGYVSTLQFLNKPEDVVCVFVLPTRRPFFHFKILFWFRKVDCDDFILTFSFLFQEKAQLAYFDYGDVICTEGEMPQGIYLIISGMAIVRDYVFFPENASWNM